MSTWSGHPGRRRGGRRLESVRRTGRGGNCIAAVPVPQESMLAMRSAYGPFLASDWKTPSAMVDRQMLPKQTNRTEMGEDIGMWKEIGRNGIGGAWIRRCCRCVCFTTGTVVGQRAGHDGPERISRVRVRRVNTDDSRVEARQQSRQRQPLDWAANLGPTKRINNLKGKNGKRREWEMFCPRHRPRQLQTFQFCRSAAAASCRSPSGAPASAQTRHSPIN